MDDVKPVLLMDGESDLVIGRGRKGKTGFALDLSEEYIEEIKFKKSIDAKFLVIVPQVTNVELLEYDSYENPMNAEELSEAYNRMVDSEFQAKREGLVVIISGKVKGQESIWKILRDPMFRDFVILGDELAVLTSDADDEREFKIFIRHVGQNNQRFIGTSHRIKDDMPPVTALNVTRIWFVGKLADPEEIRKLYNASTLNTTMTYEEFETKIRNQPDKYNWWDKKPNRNAVLLIFS